MSNKVHRPRSIMGWWRAVEVIGWIYIATAAIAPLGLIAAWSLGSVAGDGALDLSWLTDTVAATLLLNLAATYIGAVVTLIWYYQANRNAHALGLKLDTQPHWAVLWFFIPFAALFKPYGVTAELWRSSTYPDGWRSKSDPLRMRLWWAAYLAGVVLNMLGNVIGRAVAEDQLATGLLMSVPSNVAFALAGLLFLSLGREIAKRQQALIQSGFRPAPRGAPSWAP